MRKKLRTTPDQWLRDVTVSRFAPVRGEHAPGDGGRSASGRLHRHQAHVIWRMMGRKRASSQPDFARAGGAAGGGWRWAVVLVLVLGAWLLLRDVLQPPPPVSAVDMRFGRCGEHGGTACVIDGDTLAIGRRRVRLTGYDAPELEGACEAERAKARRQGRAARMAGHGQLQLDRRREAAPRPIWQRATRGAAKRCIAGGPHDRRRAGREERLG